MTRGLLDVASEYLSHKELTNLFVYNKRDRRPHQINSIETTIKTDKGLMDAWMESPATNIFLQSQTNQAGLFFHNSITRLSLIHI